MLVTITSVIAGVAMIVSVISALAEVVVYPRSSKRLDYTLTQVFAKGAFISLAFTIVAGLLNEFI